MRTVIKEGTREGVKSHSVFAVCLVLIILPLSYLAACFGEVYFTARVSYHKTADVIVVMGAAEFDGVPSKVLAARLNQAYRLFAMHLAPLIILTGGKEGGDKVTEAQAAKAYILRWGVPSRDIVTLQAGRDTFEEVDEAAIYMDQRSLRSAILVSDPFHSFRVTQIASQLGLVAHPSPTRTSPIRGDLELRYMFREAVAVAAGNLIGYRSLSDLLHGAPLVRLW
ncbi:MAG: YdcF family protein [Acidimicrobiaceae bacterium]|nr:YdcF family protein [Acidimicrobiaceae bacterium]